MNEQRQPAPDSPWPSSVQQHAPMTTGYNWQKKEPPQQLPTQPQTPAQPNQQAFDWSSARRTTAAHSAGSTPGQPRTPTPGSPSSVPGTDSPQFTASGASVRDRAIAGDQDALETLFGQFIPQGEQIVDCRYMGVLGIWGIGTHSFAAITPNRAASLKMSMLGGVHYQDGPLEYVNSAAIFQPSRVGLYINVAATVLIFGFLAFTGGILFLILLPLVMPLAVRLHYRLHKSGLILWVREGLAIYIFIDRSRMKEANRYYRTFCDLREERIKATGASI